MGDFASYGLGASLGSSLGDGSGVGFSARDVGPARRVAAGTIARHAGRTRRDRGEGAVRLVGGERKRQRDADDGPRPDQLDAPHRARGDVGPHLDRRERRSDGRDRQLTAAHVEAADGDDHRWFPTRLGDAIEHDELCERSRRSDRRAVERELGEQMYFEHPPGASGFGIHHCVGDERQRCAGRQHVNGLGPTLGEGETARAREHRRERGGTGTDQEARFSAAAASAAAFFPCSIRALTFWPPF